LRIVGKVDLLDRTLAHSFMFHYDFWGCFADLQLGVANRPTSE